MILKFLLLGRGHSENWSMQPFLDFLAAPMSSWTNSSLTSFSFCCFFPLWVHPQMEAAKWYWRDVVSTVLTPNTRFRQKKRKKSKHLKYTSTFRFNIISYLFPDALFCLVPSFAFVCNQSFILTPIRWICKHSVRRLPAHQEGQSLAQGHW